MDYKKFRCERCYEVCELVATWDKETYPTACPFDYDTPDFQMEVEE